MLFAETEVAAGAAVVACIATGLGGFFSWMTAREKSKFDAGVIEMRLTIENLQNGAIESKADRDEIRAEMEQCHAAREKERGERAIEREELADLRARIRHMERKTDSERS